MPSSTLREVIRDLSSSGVDVAALGLAWARALPTVTLVPAFGLRALPAPARMVMALALAGCIFPAMPPVASSSPWMLTLVMEVGRGLPIAVAAAVPLWAATMAGGVVDTLRGSQAMVSGPTVDGQTTMLGVPMSLLACAIFLKTGGPSRIARALAIHPAQPLVAVAQEIAGGITFAVALAVPLLVASVVIELGTSLIARAASPAQVHALLAPLRAMGVLAAFAVVLDRMATMLAWVLRDVP